MPRTPVLTAAAIAAALIGYAAAPASAATASLGGAPPALEKQTASNIELVQSRNYKKRRWYYNRGRHGPRYPIATGTTTTITMDGGIPGRGGVMGRESRSVSPYRSADIMEADMAMAATGMSNGVSTATGHMIRVRIRSWAMTDTAIAATVRTAIDQPRKPWASTKSSAESSRLAFGFT